MKKNKYLLFLFSILINLNCYTQISIGGTPYGIENINYQSGIPVVYTPALNMPSILAEDMADNIDGIPYRFGYPHVVSYNLNNSGIWKTLRNGDKLWQLKVVCTGAKSINFIFNEFHLPSTAKLYIYNPISKKKIGGFTSINNKGSLSSPGALATGILYGDNVIVELSVPSNQQSSVKLQIEKIIHGYRFLNSNINNLKLFGESSSCNVNINCPEGASKKDVKRGVAMVIINGSRLATGSLVNNTSQDRMPLFLTSDFGLNSKNLTLDKYDAVTEPIANSKYLSFVWDYEAPSCSNPTNEPPVNISTGAIVLANNKASDFSLLLLLENPLNLMPPVYLYYNGWDRNPNPDIGGYVIHHPMGDIKKISHFNSPPISNSSYTDVGRTIDAWETTWTQTQTNWGVTERSSTGAPLFLNNNRIIGQLFTGPSYCSVPAFLKKDYSGKFSTSWNNSTINKRRLKDWLDPTNSNVQFLDGLDGINCNLTVINNQVLNNPPVYQACMIQTLGNTIVNSGTSLMQVSRLFEVLGDFEVMGGSEFEVSKW